MSDIKNTSVIVPNLNLIPGQSGIITTLDADVVTAIRAQGGVFVAVPYPQPALNRKQAAEQYGTLVRLNPVETSPDGPVANGNAPLNYVAVSRVKVSNIESSSHFVSTVSKGDWTPREDVPLTQTNQQLLTVKDLYVAWKTDPTTPNNSSKQLPRYQGGSFDAPDRQSGNIFTDLKEMFNKGTSNIGPTPQADNSLQNQTGVANSDTTFAQPIDWRNATPYEQAEFYISEILAGQHDPLDTARTLSFDNQSERLRSTERILRRTIGKDTRRSLNERVRAIIPLMPSEPSRTTIKELKRYEEISSSASQQTELENVRHVLNNIVSLPWGEEWAPPVFDNLQIPRQILDKNHAGMADTKERILDVMASWLYYKHHVWADTLGTGVPLPPPFPSILLVGPFGTGKTTIIKSVAEAFGYKFEFINCGALTDPQSLIGFMRTFVGAKTGAVMDKLKDAGTIRCLLAFDEIDKIPVNNPRGNVHAALMEIADPEQNHSFRDQFLTGIPVDLSGIPKIYTANSIQDIPRGLLDRLTVIEVSGYTSSDKHKMVNSHLWNRVCKKQFIDPKMFRISESAIQCLVTEYTNEAGVRRLEQTLYKLVSQLQRKHLVVQPAKPVIITDKDVRDLLGPSKQMWIKVEPSGPPGYTTMLWVDGESGQGGMCGMSVKLVQGKSGIEMTGNLKEMFTETIRVARSYVRSEVQSLWKPEYNGTFDPALLDRTLLHIHVENQGVPKDGPSAGVPILMAMISAITETPLPEGIAMTGEISLDGKVHAVGGIPEKMLAAHRAGRKLAFIPKQNEDDVRLIPKDVRDEMKIVLVEHVSEVIDALFGPTLQKRKQEEVLSDTVPIAPEPITPEHRVPSIPPIPVESCKPPRGSRIRLTPVRIVVTRLGRLRRQHVKVDDRSNSGEPPATPGLN